jgi:C4-dicarboxylate-specific signal transduction histidine kinase
VIGERAYAKAAPYLEEALAGRQVAFTQDLELSDGRLRTMEAMYVPELDARGDVSGLYILAIDVTERDRALQESRRLQDELLHAGRIATMGELAGTLAHEINQPLSAIMSNAQAATRFLRLPAPDMQEIREILEDIVKEDARAGEIINRLRALLKKTSIAPEPLDLNLILREVSGLLRSNAVVRDIKIALDLAPRLPLVSGDRIQLQQVALNLLLNAFEAMDDCPKADRRVSIRTRGQDGRVQASVADSGSGIPAGATESIFDPYHTSKPQGLGLGLSICRTIIKRHQGRIWAENRPAGGAALHFSLPAQQEACCAT